MRIGLMGGTFDPVHLGHLAAARAAAECARLDLVLLVPSGRPPHRSAAPVAPAIDRFDMCRLAVRGMRGIGVWDFEVGREGPSYTYDTLERFAATHPGESAHLILGWDAAREFGSWYRPADVSRLARIVIIGRPGVSGPAEDELRPAGLDPKRVILCRRRTPDVSATAVRARVAAGAPLAGLVPDAVAAYIADHGLYRGSPAS